MRRIQRSLFAAGLAAGLCLAYGEAAAQFNQFFFFGDSLTDAGSFKGVRVVGITGGKSTPIEDLHAVTRRILELAGTPDARARADELATAALSEAATPAGRTTSLPSAKPETSRPTSGAA